MKKTAKWLVVAVCLCLIIGLAAIAGSNDAADRDSYEDTCSYEENGIETSGIALKTETVYLEIDPTSEEVQLTGDSVLTNTTQITVSAERITGDTQIALFLYNADDMDAPILYATLTAKNKSVDFTNLTSRFAYKVGATIEGTEEKITLKITD